MHTGPRSTRSPAASTPSSTAAGKGRESGRFRFCLGRAVIKVQAKAYRNSFKRGRLCV
jgi:hypothetical protein